MSSITKTRYPFYLVTVIGDSLRPRGYVLTAEEAEAQGLYHGWNEDGKRADKYCDGYQTREEAEQARRDLKNA